MVDGKISAIIQTRLSSTRLPAKAMLDLNGKTLLSRVINRVNLSKYVNDIWIATSNNPSDDIIEIYIKKKQLNIYRGSLENVFQRFIDVVKLSKAEIFVRVTGDNPLTEPTFIDQAITKIKDENADYVRFTEIPYGTGIEVIRTSSFLSLQNEQLDAYEKEHVTPYFYRNPSKFSIILMEPDKELQRPEIRLTMDTFEDYNYLTKVLTALEDQPAPLTLNTIISFIDNHPNLKS